MTYVNESGFLANTKKKKKILPTAAKMKPFGVLINESAKTTLFVCMYESDRLHTFFKITKF